MLRLTGGPDARRSCWGAIDMPEALWCPRCRTTEPEGRFCPSCGGRLEVLPEQMPSPRVPAPHAAAAAPEGKSGALPRWMAVSLKIWVVAAIIAAMLGAVGGWLSGRGGPRTVDAGRPRGNGWSLTSEQKAVSDKLGRPQVFTVADGPLSPGGEQHRTELWLYKGERVQYTFFDGREVTRTPAIEKAYPPDCPGKVAPWDLHSGLSRGEVESLLGEQGEHLETTTSPYPDSVSYRYVRNRLLIGYLGDRFFAAQSY